MGVSGVSGSNSVYRASSTTTSQTQGPEELVNKLMKKLMEAGYSEEEAKGMVEATFGKKGEGKAQPKPEEIEHMLGTALQNKGKSQADVDAAFREILEPVFGAKPSNTNQSSNSANTGYWSFGFTDQFNY